MHHLTLCLSSALILAGMAGAARAELANFEVSGLVETEFAVIDSDADGTSSDIYVPTVELALGTTFSDQVSASVVLLAEDPGTADETSAEVDQAILLLALRDITMTIGRTTLPFGRFQTGAISDPLTLQLGETSETLVMFGQQRESGLGYSLFLFNGDAEEAGENDQVDDLGFNIDVAGDHWSAGLAYVSNLADSDTLNDIGVSLADKVAGLDVYGSISAGDFSVALEYVGALDELAVGDLAGDTLATGISSRARPAAAHLELGMAMGDGRRLVLSYNASDEAGELGLYESALAIAYSGSADEHLGYAVEIRSAEAYNGDKDASLKVQLALRF